MVIQGYGSIEYADKTYTAKGGGRLWQMLTVADKGGRRVREMLKFTDKKGGRGLDPTSIFG